MLDIWLKWGFHCLLFSIERSVCVRVCGFGVKSINKIDNHCTVHFSRHLEINGIQLNKLTPSKYSNNNNNFRYACLPQKQSLNRLAMTSYEECQLSGEIICSVSDLEWKNAFFLLRIYFGEKISTVIN